MNGISFKEMLTAAEDFESATPAPTVIPSKSNIFEEKKSKNKMLVLHPSTTKKNDSLFQISSKKRKFSIGSTISDSANKENTQKVVEESFQSKSTDSVRSIIPQYLEKQIQLNKMVKDIITSIQICNQEARLLQDESITAVLKQFEMEFQSYIIQINK